MTANREFPYLTFDPARGDTVAVREIAEQLASTGNYAGDAHDVLKSVQDRKEVWTGEAAKVFVERLDQLPEYLRKARDSLGQASAALHTWADRLEAHQKKAWQLEDDCREAVLDQQEKEETARTANELLTRFQGSPEQVARLQMGTLARLEAARVAADRVEDIRRQAGDVRDRWEDDARFCADALKNAGEEAPQKAFFESIGDLFGDFGKWCEDALEGIGDIAGVISGITGALAFIPFCTPLFAPIALATGAIAFGLHAGDMIVNGKAGDVSAWLSLGADAVGMIPGFKALNAGVDAAVAAFAGTDRLVDVSRTGSMFEKLGDAWAGGVRGFADDLPGQVGKMGDSSSLLERGLANQPRIGANPLVPPVTISAEAAPAVARMIQGSVTAGVQAPSAAGLFESSDANSEAKDKMAGISVVLGGLTAIG